MKSKTKMAKAALFAVVTAILTLGMSVFAFASDPVVVTSPLEDLDLIPHMNAFISDATGIIMGLVPIAIGLLLVLAVPRIVRRIIGAFV